MSKKKFGILWNYKQIKGGFMLNIFTIFRFALQLGTDMGGKFVQFQFGIYNVSLTLQLGID